MRTHQVRVTGVLIEQDRLLLVRQRVRPDREWSLPGGRVQGGESLAQALIREMREETGLRVSVVRLLYVAEEAQEALLHITFLLRREGGRLELPTNEHDANPISDVRFVPIADLPGHGFAALWRDLAAGGFPNAPAYVGPKSAIGL